MFFPKSSLCAGRPDESDIEIVSDTYLVCELNANHGVRPVPEWRTVAVRVRDDHWLPVRSARHAGLVGADQPIAASVRQRQQLSQLAGAAVGGGTAVKVAPRQFVRVRETNVKHIQRYKTIHMFITVTVSDVILLR